MNLRKLMLAGAAMATMSAIPAQASIVDNPHFKVLGLVIVWGADDAGNTPIVSDFIIDTAVGAGDHDLIGTDDVHTVVTGSLTPTSDSSGTIFTVDGTSTDSNSDGVLDANDTFGQFALTDTTDVSGAAAVHNSSFFVASNTGFQINATASVATGSTPVNFALSDVNYSLAVTADDTGQTGITFGADAQDPHSAGTGVQSVANLAAMTGVPVFIGDRKTAATPGSITEQSVRFDATYTLGAGGAYDLSMGAGEIEADVVYTVFVP